MTTQESFKNKLDRIENRKARRQPDREKSFVRDEVETSILTMMVDLVLFGGWYVLAGLAFAALVVLSVLGFIGFEIGALFVVAFGLYLLFSYLSDR